MVDIYLITFLLFVAAPISIFLHELGHALAGVIFKAELVYLTIGRGKRVIEYSSGKLHFIIHAGYFMGDMQIVNESHLLIVLKDS
ncbi:hypothetical protein OBCHQ24_09745 [Oceanobacillus iheyensis]|nr:hypothetical protein OBCHQ24_09745 [Oceanobacillus iheyensis]